jgi:hypothetical protein
MHRFTNQLQVTPAPSLLLFRQRFSFPYVSTEAMNVTLFQLDQIFPFTKESHMRFVQMVGFVVKNFAQPTCSAITTLE